MPIRVDQMPALNASLNALAGLLLLLGYAQIKFGRERGHKWTMLAAFAVSIVFLISYLAYHIWPIGHRDTPFEGQGLVRPLYFSILISHVLLAAAVPFLAGVTIYWGLQKRWAKHRRIARWTFPIWLYVSVTGVVIYVMLYVLYPASAAAPIIE